MTVRLVIVGALVASGCTQSLHVPGEPIGCDSLGGQVEGSFLDPAGVSTMFGPVSATLTSPTTVTLTDGTLSLVLGIGAPPRAFDLVFPGRPVLPTTGKLVLDEDQTCYAGRFDGTFVYHGEISGWFAVP